MSEAAILAGLCAGDLDAFRAAYDRYKADVIAMAAAILGRQEEAWDVLQTVFVSFARQARKLDRDSNLKAYLLTAAANRARDLLGRRRDRPIDDDTAASAVSDAGEPLELLVRTEEAHRLWQAIVALPEDQRIVVALHIYGELTFKQIAESQDQSENTVASRYRYAIQKLKLSMREYANEH